MDMPPDDISMEKRPLSIILPLIPVFVSGFSMYAQEDPDIASLIMPDSGSVVEGDGMYSIALGDGRSLFLMGDSFIGEVERGVRVSGDHMYRNTYSVFDHRTFSSRALAGAAGKETSAAVPEGVTDESARWYWPGHGFVVGDRLYVFQFLMYSGEGPAGWNFHYGRTDILQYSLPDIGLVPEKAAPVPYSGEPGDPPSREHPQVHFGAAALNDLDSTGYLYIYAQVDVENGWTPVTEVYVARTTEKDLFISWEYYTGTGWSRDQDMAAALQGLDTVPVSSQFNVFKLDGKYALLTQDKSWNSGKIYTFTSGSPWGPWENKTLVYQVPDLPDTDWYSYNAMAHPQFGKNGKILISYNVNTGDFQELKTNVSSYRPRMVWVDKDLILGKDSGIFLDSGF